jgi:hypothetical protein
MACGGSCRQIQKGIFDRSGLKRRLIQISGGEDEQSVQGVSDADAVSDVGTEFD